MAKKALLTIDGVHKKVKKGLLTIDGTHKKVKKAFVTIGGVYRPCWSGGELAYYGSIPSLVTTRYGLAATTVGDYAVFAGGYDGSYFRSEADYYNSSLTHSSNSSANISRYDLAAATVGDYGVFVGGKGPGSWGATWSYTNTVNACNSSLTWSQLSAMPKQFGNHAGTTLGNYALFAGNQNDENVYAFDASLTRTESSASNRMSSKRIKLAATTVGNYALFGGGDESTSYGVANVDAYDSSLTKTTVSSLARARYLLAATTVGNYALFAGGNDDDYFSKVVDVYDTSLTKSVATELSVARFALSATTVGDYALFFSGDMTFTLSTTAVDAYDASLTRTNQPENGSYTYGAATTVGNYALVGGGIFNDSNSVTSGVYAYTVA